MKIRLSGLFLLAIIIVSTFSSCAIPMLKEDDAAYTVTGFTTEQTTTEIIPENKPGIITFLTREYIASNAKDDDKATAYIPQISFNTAGASALNKKITDDFESDTLSSEISGKKATSIVYKSYTGERFIIIEKRIMYNYEKDNLYYTLYYYDVKNDCELTFDEYLSSIGESKQSVLNIINQDHIRLANSGYYYKSTYIFTENDLIGAFKLDIGSFYVPVNINKKGFSITTPYKYENGYYLTAIPYANNNDSRISTPKYEGLKITFYNKSELRAPSSYKPYEVLWADDSKAVITYYPQENRRNFHIVKLGVNEGYGCGFTAAEILQQNGLDPSKYNNLQEPDIFPVSISNNILTAGYKLENPAIEGTFYCDLATYDVYFEGKKDLPLYIADAQRLIKMDGNNFSVLIPRLGTTVSMVLPCKIKTASYNCKDGNEEIYITNESDYNFKINICDTRNVEVSATEKLFYDSFPVSNGHPGELHQMISSNVFISNLVYDNGHIPNEYLLGYYIPEKNVVVWLRFWTYYSLEDINTIAKNITHS